MDVNVKDKVVVITGAGGGIGRATALKFAASGARVVATDLDENLARATVDAIEAGGGRRWLSRTTCRRKRHGLTCSVEQKSSSVASTSS